MGKKSKELWPKWWCTTSTIKKYFNLIGKKSRELWPKWWCTTSTIKLKEKKLEKKNPRELFPKWWCTHKHHKINKIKPEKKIKGTLAQVSDATREEQAHGKQLKQIERSTKGFERTKRNKYRPWRVRLTLKSYTRRTAHGKQNKTKQKQKKKKKSRKQRTRRRRTHKME